MGMVCYLLKLVYVCNVIYVPDLGQVNSLYKRSCPTCPPVILRSKAKVASVGF